MDKNKANLIKLRSAGMLMACHSQTGLSFLLGRLERYAITRNHLGFYNCICCTAYYKSDNVSISKDLVVAALASVLAKNPALSAIPAGEDTPEPYFLRPQIVDLERHVSFVTRQKPLDNEGDDPELEEQHELQLNKPVADPSEFLPPWRLVILLDPKTKSEFTACLVYHHAIADGMSGKAFHECFSSALSEASPTGLQSKVHTPDLPLSPPLEVLHSLPISYWFFIRSIWEAFFRRVPAGLWSGGIYKLPLRTRLRTVIFPTDTSIRVVERCRENGTTVTAMAQAVVAAATFEAVPQEFSILHCEGTMSLRRFLPPNIIHERSMGYWVSSFSEYYRRGGTIWDEARRSRTAIEKLVANKGRDLEISLLRYVKDFDSFFLSRLGRKRARSFDLTNVGIFRDSQQSKHWKAGRMIFTQSACVSGSAFAVSIVTGGDGSLALSYSWQEGVVEEQVMQQIIDTVSLKLNEWTG